MERLGVVWTDPIPCPTRAQDLILRHRVKGYRAGDSEGAYAGFAQNVFEADMSEG